MAQNKSLPCELTPVRSISDLSKHDILLIVTTSLDHPKLQGDFSSVHKVINVSRQHDKSVEKTPSFYIGDNLPTKRVVLSPTGPINRDQDDVRRFADATAAAVKRALAAECKRPALLVLHNNEYVYADSVAVLAALQILYVPLEIREDVPSRTSKVDQLGVWTQYSKSLGDDLPFLAALECGRSVCRDIGGSDPERMAAPQVEKYLRELFSGSSEAHVKMEVISNDGGSNQLDKEYPLLAAVNRCAQGVERHRGRVIHLEYTGAGEIKETVCLVGKGVTYDTGGADIKAGGVMAGMHRDKCGSAAVAGFFHFLSVSRPAGVRVLGMMCMVRNSVGRDCYVADEIITSRAGVRVRVGNTDAEGRMAMADPLCHMKEKILALKATNVHVYTVATLTGHAIRAMGPNYTIVMDNGPARRQHHAHTLQEAGEMMGEPVEISTIRREDYDFVAGRSEYEDLLQANNAPSTMTPRGHQYPAAFIIQAAGLDKHGLDSESPIRYSHMDIAGSSGPFPGVPTGAPIVALATKYFKINK